MKKRIFKKKLCVVDWVDCEYGNENSFGGFGGWFNSHLIHKNEKRTKLDTWRDYLKVACKNNKERVYAETLKRCIKVNNYQFKGGEHQYQRVPLFSDGTTSLMSFRAWGDFMAAIYSTKENPLTYMEYYY